MPANPAAALASAARSNSLPKERQDQHPKKKRTRFANDPRPINQQLKAETLDSTLTPTGIRWFNLLKKYAIDAAQSDLPTMLESAHLAEDLEVSRADIRRTNPPASLYNAHARLVAEQARILQTLGCTPRTRRQEVVHQDKQAQVQADLSKESQFGDLSVVNFPSNEKR